MVAKQNFVWNKIERTSVRPVRVNYKEAVDKFRPKIRKADIQSKVYSQHIQASYFESIKTLWVLYG